MSELPDSAFSQNGDTKAGDGPVFILTASRSGSTLLRFILDSHPDLACPPETLIGATCRAMVRLWESLEHFGDAERTGIYDSLSVSAAGLGMIRMALDSAYDSYLERRGKRRWCDKSLDTFQFAGILRKIFPDAKFICLVRHCMDVIASGVSNCPWGLTRYGFDPFVMQYPGNSVAAIGAYWLSCTRTIVDFHDQNQDACILVRYEDLVTTPEATVAGLLRFIEASPSPEITEACFARSHEERGAGDEKIWFTNHVSTDSMGQGISVPATALPPEMRTSINEVLTRLRYKVVGADWRAAVGGLDPRTDAPPAPANPARDDGSGAESGRVIQALRDRLHGASATIASQWPSLAGVAVRLVAESLAGDHAELSWRFASANCESDAAAPSATPLLAASPATWMSLLEGKANMMTAILDGRLRYFNPNDTHRIRSDEVHAIGALLGLATVPVAHHTTRAAGSPAAAQASRAEALAPLFQAERWRSSRALRYSATTSSVSSRAEVSSARLSSMIRPSWIRFTRSHTSRIWP
jgi:hypothetical protein